MGRSASISPNSVLPSARGYAICTTQRSGSNYLCELLNSTGVLGKPLDYFNAVGRRAKGWGDYPDDPERQVETIVPHGSTSNAVYGCKVFALYLDALIPLGWSTRLPQLRWVFLHRDGLLDQAISLVVAKQTEQWRSGTAPLHASTYDAAAIQREMTGIADDNARWRRYFAENGLRPLVLTYDTLVGEPEAAVLAVAGLMAIEEPVKIDPSRLTVGIQRNDRNLEWKQRFLRESELDVEQTP